MPVIVAKAGDWFDLITQVIIQIMNCADDTAATATDKQIMSRMIIYLGRTMPDGSMSLSNSVATLLSDYEPDDGKAFKAAQKIIEECLLAGAILHQVLRLAFWAEEKASVENAIKVMQANTKKNGFRTVSRSKLMKVWGTYKPTAHYCAAAVSIIHLLVQHSPNLKTLESMDIDAMVSLLPEKIVHSLEALDELTMKGEKAEMLKKLDEAEELVRPLLEPIICYFFGIAEELLGYAASHYAHGQKALEKPLLNKAEAFTISESFEVIKPGLNFKPLSDFERDRLGIVNQS